MHLRLWPGIEVVPHLVGRTSNKTDAQQVAWLAKSAMPTSLAMSYITWAMTQLKRRLEDRKLGFDLLSQLLHKLHAAQNITVQISKHMAAGWTPTCLDAQLRIEGRLIGLQMPNHMPCASVCGMRNDFPRRV